MSAQAPIEAPDIVDWADGRITDEGVAHLRAQIGLRQQLRPWNSEVTRDAIWHFAVGIGDDNPMWWDEDYARRSVWGGMIAPPSFLYSCQNGGQSPDDTRPFGTDGLLPGALGIWASSKWIWHRPARLGDKVRLFWEITDAIDNPNSKFGGRAIDQIDRNIFMGEDDKPIAEVYRTIKRFERAATRSKGRFEGRKLATYTEADRAHFARQYESEVLARRGAKPFFIEDVRPGDSLGTLLKGPLTVTNLIGWLLGWGSGFCQTNRMAYQFLKNHPGSRVFNPETGIEDTIEAPHWDAYLANQGGYPAGYDFGGQRIAWLTHLLTDWAGDAAFLEELEAKLLRPNLIGDVTWIRGAVEEVVPGKGFGHALCKIETTNQLDELTTVATARMRLPSRQA